MPAKLIGFILFILLIFAFIGFNLDNYTNINLWVNEKGHFENVSIIIVVFTAYLFGLLSTVPFWFSRSLKRKREDLKDKKMKTTSSKEINQSSFSDKNDTPQKKSLFRLKKQTIEEKNS